MTARPDFTMTRAVNYDLLASDFDRRYERNRYEGVQAALRRFIGDGGNLAAAEVGCGTGHWLADLHGRVRRMAGLDPSVEMLQHARTAAPAALIVRGRAEQLPWVHAVFDRLFCINALHHFADHEAFMLEARRVLRAAGRILIVGLDPHTGLDSWWIYECFPSARQRDLERYPAAASIRARLGAAGFTDAMTEIAQHIPAAIPFAAAVERGVVDRSASSQLTLLSDAEYEAGIERLRIEQPILRADLRLYATTAVGR